MSFTCSEIDSLTYICRAQQTIPRLTPNCQISVYSWVFHYIQLMSASLMSAAGVSVVCLVWQCNRTQWVMWLLCLRGTHTHTHTCVISHLWPNTSAMQSSDSSHPAHPAVFWYILPLVISLWPKRQRYQRCSERQTDVEAGVDASILKQSGGHMGRALRSTVWFCLSASALHTAAADA